MNFSLTPSIINIDKARTDAYALIGFTIVTAKNGMTVDGLLKNKPKYFYYFLFALDLSFFLSFNAWLLDDLCLCYLRESSLLEFSDESLPLLESLELLDELSLLSLFDFLSFF